MELPVIEDLRFDTNRGYSRPPTVDEVTVKAATLFRPDGKGTPKEKKDEAYRRLLAEAVWNNPWILANIILHSTDKHKIQVLCKVEKKVDKQVMEFITWRSKTSWRAAGYEQIAGEVLIVILQTKGEVHLTPKKNFHPTMTMDW